MPFRVRATELLTQWRAIERRYALAPEGEEADRLLAEMKRLRSAYLAVIEEAAAAHSPEPPPFPGRGVKTDGWETPG